MDTLYMQCAMYTKVQKLLDPNQYYRIAVSCLLVPARLAYILYSLATRIFARKSQEKMFL